MWRARIIWTLVILLSLALAISYGWFLYSLGQR
jgi:hypothetical protein